VTAVMTVVMVGCFCDRGGGGSDDSRCARMVFVVAGLGYTYGGGEGRSDNDVCVCG
jgi:hypothetical protein